MKVTVSNPPMSPQPAHCQSREGCKNEAQKRWDPQTWLCNYHFYRLYRAVEMNNDEPEAA